MTQKFELDPDLPAYNQIKKTEFNIETKRVSIYYHYEEGKITTHDEDYDRDDLIGHATPDNVNDKDQEESKDMQIKKKYHELEMHCHQQINGQENQMASEIMTRNESENSINQQRSSQSNPDELFVRILEKSIYAKARDKMKLGKKNDQDDTAQEQNTDILLPILKKCGYDDGQQLEEEAAILVKNEALRSLKERLLTRATIIQNRLD